MTRYECRALTGLMLITLALGCSRSQQSADVDEKVLAVVNGVRLTESGLRDLVPNDFYDTLRPEHKKEIINEWVNSELLYQEALRMKLDNDPAIRKIIENTRRTLLTNEILEKKLTELKAPEPDELRKYYEERKQNFVVQETEYRIRYAAFDSRKESEDFWGEIKKGRTSFSELAQSRSKDPSASSGGNIGIVSQETVAPEIWEAIEKTVKRYGLVKLSDPFTVGDGWGCVIVDQIFEPGSAKSFEEAHDQVLDIFMAERRDQLKSEFLKKLASDAKITYSYDTEGGK